VLAPEIPVAGELALPEDALSGFDVVLPEQAPLGAESFSVLLRFDVARSFVHEAMDVNRWVMQPHVTAEASLSEVELRLAEH
jgi:hypothetical protein